MEGVVYIATPGTTRERRLRFICPGGPCRLCIQCTPAPSGHRDAKYLDTHLICNKIIILQHARELHIYLKLRSVFLYAQNIALSQSEPVLLLYC